MPMRGFIPQKCGIITCSTVSVASKVMSKFVFLLLLIFAYSTQVFTQVIEYPWRPNSIPSAKFKGAVHTILTIEQRDEDVFSTEVEVYDLNGRLIETMSSNANIEVHSGKLFRLGTKSIYSYDTNGKLIKIKNFAPEGDYMSYVSYNYDSKNRLIEAIGHDTKDKIIHKTTYNHLPEKRAIEATWQVYYEDRKSTPVKKMIFYDEKDRFIKRDELEADRIDTVSFEYDAKGNFVKEIHCCKYNYSHRYSYKFDKQGNWIERENTYVQFDKNGKEEVTPGWMNTYRVITYYSDYETKP